jgi:hypothetical protein
MLSEHLQCNNSRHLMCAERAIYYCHIAGLFRFRTALNWCTPRNRYGDEVREARVTVQERRADLIRVATADLQAAVSDGADIAALTVLLDRYALYPSDVDQLRTSVQRLLQSQVGNAEEQIKAALAASDVELVDSCIKQYTSFEELGPLLKRLEQHRTYLQDSIFDRLKAAMHFTSPSEIQAVITLAQPFLTDSATAEVAENVRGHLDKIQQDAVAKLREALETDPPDPDALQAAAEEFKSFDDAPDVKPVLSEVRQKLDSMHQQVRDDIRVAIMEGDPLKIKQMLQEANK